jgi:hypothetical protein
MSHEDLHTCSYSCQRPACIERQRNELFSYTMDIYKVVQGADPKHRMTFKQVMEYAANQLREKP